LSSKNNDIDNKKLLALFAIDNVANVVIWDRSHLLQGIEEYNNYIFCG
jgi:hypothetical protein